MQTDNSLSELEFAPPLGIVIFNRRGRRAMDEIQTALSPPFIWMTFSGRQAPGPTVPSPFPMFLDNARRPDARTILRAANFGGQFRIRCKLRTVDLIQSSGFPIKMEGSMIFCRIDRPAALYQ
jgi:hypothetical protein